MRHTTNETTARFWTWENGGWVKLSLRPGDELGHTTGGPHDEGFSRTWRTWGLSEGLVEHESWTESRDCDGRHSSGVELECEVSELKSEGRPSEPGVRTPKWETLGTSLRDHTAEAAGF